MAGELITPIGITGWTVYNMVFDFAGKVWSTVTSAFVTYATADRADYDLATTEQGTASGIYIGDFPSAVVAAAHGKTYRVVSSRQAGGSPAESDSIIASGEIAWKIDEKGVRLADAVTHGGANAILDLQKIIVTATGQDDAVRALGSGTGRGLAVFGGNSGVGAVFAGGLDRNGVAISGVGDASGLACAGGAQGGAGILAISQGGGGDGFKCTGHATGVDINADILNTLRSFYRGVTFASVNDGTPSDTTFITNLTEVTDTHYENAVCLFLTGTLRGQTPRQVSSYNGTTKTIVVASAYTEAPANGDEFAIIGVVA